MEVFILKQKLADIGINQMPSYCPGCLIQATCKEICKKQNKFVSAAVNAFIKLYLNTWGIARDDKKRNVVLVDHIKTIQKAIHIGVNTLEIVDGSNNLYWTHLKNTNISI